MVGEKTSALADISEHTWLYHSQTGPGPPGHETSVFGLKTSRALKLFQTSHGLRASGFLSPLTRAAISVFAATSTPSSPRTAPATPHLAATPAPHCDAPVGLTCAQLSATKRMHAGCRVSPDLLLVLQRRVWIVIITSYVMSCFPCLKSEQCADTFLPRYSRSAILKFESYQAALSRL
jgi:hypothetical protein